MPNYQSAKIYKLTSEFTNRVYLGSTTKPLTKRLQGHKDHNKQWKNGNRGYMTSFALFELGTVNIELIENYPCDTKQELEARERFHIENEPNALNKQHPGRTKAEYRQENRERILEKIQCEICNSMISRAHMAGHKRTKKCSNSSSESARTTESSPEDSELEELNERLSRF